MYHHLCTLDNVVYERVLLNYTTYIDISMLATHQLSTLTITNCFAQRSDSNWHHRYEAVCFHYTTFANTINITSYIDVYRVLWYACFAVLTGLEPVTTYGTNTVGILTNWTTVLFCASSWTRTKDLLIKNLWRESNP